MRLLVIALLLLAGQEDVSKEALKGYAHSWDGFGAGSYIRVSHTCQEAVYDSEKKKMVFKDVAYDRTFTVEKIEKDRVWVKPAQFGTSDLPCDVYAVGLPDEMNGKGVLRGEEEVTIEGKAYSCKVYEIQSPSAIVKIWKHADVPAWAVKVLIVVDAKSNPRREETVCVSMADRVKVDETEVGCVVFETTVESGDTRVQVKEWRNDGVPGRVVKRDTRVFKNHVEEKHLHQTTVVTAYEAKK